MSTTNTAPGSGKRTPGKRAWLAVVLIGVAVVVGTELIAKRLREPARPAQPVRSAPPGQARPEDNVRAFGPPPNTVIPLDKQRIGQWNAPGITDFKWNAVEVGADDQVTFDVVIPADHRLLTVVIDDEQGRRVRNLISMGDVEKLGGYPSVTRAQPQTMTLAWNRCDDSGKPAPPGVYRVRGLSLPGLEVRFDYAWYNPGTPPWEGYPNSGWGGDHAFPTAVACAPKGSGSPWLAVVGGPCGEGGSSVVAVDNEYRKVWGFKRHWWGVSGDAIAVVDNELWMGIASDKVLMRMELGTARLLGFQRPAGVIEEVKLPEEAKALAVGKEMVAVILASNKLLLLDRRSARQVGEFQFDDARDVLFDAQSRLIVSTGGGLVAVVGDGARIPVPMEGLQGPGALACDADGNLYVMDLGPDYQVKVYSPDGKPLRAIGTKGGQQGEDFDAGAARSVSSIAVDDAGNLWVVESAHPRRVSVFDREGKLVRDFVGNTQYGASHLTQHEQDPTLACGYGVVFKLNPARTQDYRVLRFMNWRSTTGSPFDVNGGSGQPHYFHRGMMFRSNASGAMREYYLGMSYGCPVLYLEKGGKYVPVAAIGTGNNSPAFPAPDGDKSVAHLWSDKNEDELVQADELQMVGMNVQLTWFYGWTHLVGPQLEFYVDGRAIRPVGFTGAGAPLYDMGRAEKLAAGGSFIRVGDHLVGARDASPFVIGRYVFADLKGNVVATFPINWTGVHGSMNGPVPEPGETCGELFFSGACGINERLGAVVATQGNMGQVFLFTEDGLFLSSLFRDCRKGGAGYGTEVSKGADWTGCSMSQEPFGGWFGKQSDGRVRCMFGRNAALTACVYRLDEAKRFGAGLFRLGEAPPPGVRLSVQTPAGKASVLVKRVDAAPTLDGDLADWAGIESHDIKSGNDVVGSVALAHNTTRLFLAFRVKDGSPLKNAGKDFTLLFKDGDAVELLLGPAQPLRSAPVAGDLRALFAPTPRAPSAVLYRQVVPGAERDARKEFSSPVRKVFFDSVATLDDAPMVFQAVEGGYVCEGSVRFDALGVRYTPNLRLRGDLGILFSNDGGILTERHTCLFNPKANAVSDIPTEAELTPGQWGEIVLE